MTDYRMTVGSSTGVPIGFIQADRLQTAGPFDDLVEEVKERTDDTVDTAGDFTAGTFEAGENLGSGVTNFGVDVGQGIAGGFANASTGAAEKGVDVGRGVGRGLARPFVDAAQLSTDVAQGGVDYGMDISENVADTTSDIGGNAADFSGDSVGSAGGAAIGVAQNTQEFGDDFGSAVAGTTSQLFGNTADFFGDVGGNVADAGGDLADDPTDAGALYDSAEDTVQDLNDATGDYADIISSGAQDVTQAGGDFIQGNTQELAGGAGGVWGAGSEFATDVAGSLSDSTQELGGDTGDAFAGIGDTIGGTAGGQTQGSTDYRDTIGASSGKRPAFTQTGGIQTAGPFDDISGAIGGAVDEAGDAVGNIGSGFNNTVENLGSGVDNLGDNLGSFTNNISGSITAGLPDVGNIGNNIGGGLATAFQGPSSFAGDGFEGVQDLAGDVAGGVDNFAGNIGNFSDNLISSGSDFGEGVLDTADDFAGGVDDIREGVVDTSQDFAGGVEDIGEGALDLTTDIGSGAQSLGQGGIDFGTDVAEDIEGLAGGGADFIGDKASGGLEFGGDVAEGGIDLATDFGGGVSDLAEGGLDFAGDVAGDAGSLTSDVAGGIADSAYAVGNATKEAAYAGGSAVGSLTEGVVGGIGAGAAALGEGTANTLGGIANATGSAINVALKGGGKTIAKLGGGTGGGVQWGTLENAWSAQDPSGGACVVKKQQSDNGATRYFFVKLNADETGRIERGNSSITLSEIQQGVQNGEIKNMDSVPSFETLEDATNYATSNYCTGADTDTDSQDNEEVWMGLGDKVQDVATDKPSCNVYSIASQTGTTKYVTQVFVDGPSLESGTVAKAVSQQKAVTGFMGTQEFYEIAGPGEEANLNDIEWGRIPKFDTKAQAASACVNRVPKRAQGGSDTDGTGSDGTGTRDRDRDGSRPAPGGWSDPQVIETVDSLGVEVIGRQRSDTKQQFFVKDIGAKTAYTTSGSPVQYSSLSNLPNNAVLTEQQIEPTLKAIEQKRSGDGQEGNEGPEQPEDGSGGVTWSDPQQVETVRDAVILEQQSSEGETRYFAVIKIEGQTAALAAPNDAVPVNSVDSWDQLPYFPTIEEARAVVPQEQGNTQPPARAGIPDNEVRNGNQPQSTQWSDPQPVAESNNCVFLAQQGSDGSKRFFTTTQVNGKVVAIGPNGNAAVALSNVQSLDNVPSYSTADGARAVCPSQGQTVSGEQPQKPTPGEATSTAQGLDNGGSGGLLSNNLLLIGGAAAAGVGGLVLLGSGSDGQTGTDQSGGGLFSDDSGSSGTGQSDDGGGLFSGGSSDSDTGTGQTQEQGGVFQ